MNLQRTLSGGSLRVLALPMKTAEVEGLGEGGASHLLHKKLILPVPPSLLRAIILHTMPITGPLF